MTPATDKGAKYRYYKCNTRTGIGIHLCASPAMPMQKLSGIVLDAADRVFTPEPVGAILTEMRDQQCAMRHDQGAHFKPLLEEMDSLNLATDCLYNALEKGLLPMDETLRQRALLDSKAHLAGGHRSPPACLRRNDIDTSASLQHDVNKPFPLRKR
jgi:site-specific DNA recombinase